jgi:hypothetical protein
VLLCFNVSSIMLSLYDTGVHYVIHS